MKKGAAAFEWALDLAKTVDPDGGWQLDESDFGFTVGMASEKHMQAFHLRRVGCNIYGPRFDLNELAPAEREETLKSWLDQISLRGLKL